MASNRREYEMLFQLNAQLGSNYNAAFVKAQAQVTAMQKQIVDLGKTQSDISAYQKQQSTIEATRKKLETLQQQYDNIQREISETEGYSSSLENKLLSKKQAIEKTTAALEQQTQKAQQMGAALGEAGIDVNNLAKETDRLAGEIQALKEEQQSVAVGAEKMGTSGAEAIQAYHEALVASGVLDALKATYEGFVDCANASIGFESAITGVYKTVDGTDEELLAISDEIKHMATEIPATTDEIAGVAEAAGQLGIATQDVMEFTGVMIDLGESTNLTADAAATSLAKFTNITGTAAENYSRLGSVIVDLGNNFATTEADIVAMSTRLASSGTLAGLTEPEIMALAAAMSSVGIEAEAGGTAMTQTFNKIEMAVANNGDSLAEFARIAGMSAQEFATAWEEAPIVAIQAFISGLGKLDEQGESAVLVLDELGLSGIRQSNMLKSLGLAADTLASAVGTANKAWDENVALSEEASKRYATTASRQAMMQNSFNNLKIAVGDAYTPALRELYDVGTSVLNGLTDFVEVNPSVVRGLTAGASIIGVVTVGITGYTAAVKIAKIATELFTSTIPGVGTIMAVTAGVAALTAVIVSLAEAEDEETKAVREMTEASREEYFQLQELKHEYEEACELYGETSDEAMYLAWQVDELSASFESNKQSLSEYVEENEAARESMQDLLDTNRQSIEEIDQNEGTTLALVHRLQDLAVQTEQTVATQEEMKAIIAELNETVPELALSYEDVVAGVTDFEAAIEASVKAQAAAKRYETSQQGMVDALNAQHEARKALTTATANETAAKARLTAAEAEYWRMYNNLVGDGSNPYAGLGIYFTAAYKNYEAAKSALETYEDEVDKWEKKLNTANDEYERHKGILTDFANSISESSKKTEEATISWYEASQTAFDAVQTEIEELVQEYNDVYNAALSSFEGQFGLFESAYDESEEYLNASVENAQKALESQLAYWESYAENLATLQGISAEQLGITQENYDILMSYIQDGSNEAAGLAASMVANINEGNEAAVTELANTLGEVTTKREEIATTTTEWVYDFSGKMDELTQKMGETVDGLELDDEAAEAAKATILAYADAILENRDAAVDAAEQVANAVAAAFEATNTSFAEVAVERYERWKPKVPEGYDDSFAYYNSFAKPDFVIPGYASGTLHAERGVAYVGENGPELVFFNGGERVLTAAETAAITATDVTEARYSDGVGTPINVAVNIQVEGNASDQTVEALYAYGEEFTERVRSVIAEVQDDDARRRY